MENVIGELDVEDEVVIYTGNDEKMRKISVLMKGCD